MIFAIEDLEFTSDDLISKKYSLDFSFQSLICLFVLFLEIIFCVFSKNIFCVIFKNMICVV